VVQGRLRSVCAMSTDTDTVRLYVIDGDDCVIIIGYIIRCVVCCYDRHLGYLLSFDEVFVVTKYTLLLSVAIQLV
jgi:hypothetical protein